MIKQKFYIIDVFGEKKLSGNQLGVFPDSKNISSELMQKIARELNFSESTFITKKNKNKFQVRIFTPNHEVPFAGHPVIGTSFVIKEELIKRKIDEIFLDLKAGVIKVKFDYINNKLDKIWMHQNQPVFEKIINSRLIADLLNIKVNDIDSYPVQVVSTGLPMIIAALKNINAVKNSKINLNKYERLIKNLNAKAIFIFSPETYSEKNDLNARMFAPYFGVSEDPATGSAAGCLAGYLLKYKYFKNDTIDIKVEQGYEINRNSILYIRGDFDNGSFNINVGGKAFKVAEGSFLL
jgi:trans-2,3-dihydro-3-hydroxyanthranilate isomerase